MADKVNGINGSRGQSASPTDHKPSGGVVLPSGNSLQDVERSASVYSAYTPEIKPEWDSRTPAVGSRPANGDPFTKTLANGSHARLSAGAASFQPSRSKPSPIDLLNRNSSQDVDDGPLIVTTPSAVNHLNPQEKGKCKASAQLPIGTRNTSTGPAPKKVLFSTDVGFDSANSNYRHYIAIQNVTPKEVGDEMKIFCDDMEWKHKAINAVAVPDESGVLTYYLRLDDIREAQLAEHDVEIVSDGRWTVSCINQHEFDDAEQSLGNAPSSSYWDGQIKIVASFKGYAMEFAATSVTDDVKVMAEEFGEVLAFKEDEASMCPTIEFRVEYYKISDALNAVAELSQDPPRTINGKWLIAARVWTSNGELDNDFDGSTNATSNLTMTPRKVGSGNDAYYTSPTGRTQWRTDNNGRSIVVGGSIVGDGPFTPDERGRWRSEPSPHTAVFHAVSGPRSRSFPNNFYFHDKPDNGHGAHGSCQSVELWKIRNGMDVRTTIMIRNIPNEVDAPKFKKILDGAVFGHYDFSYLRMDFARHTNVGYAFVNFERPDDIIPLVEAYAGRPWPFCNTRRTFELSYATIQGRECLIEKFRNSSIMLECPQYRAMLWFTFSTAPEPQLVGIMIAFPGPNNLTKLQRSKANAGQIGLYRGRTPRADKHARRSQYDRGTTAQMLEDAQYQNQMSNSPTSYGHGHAGLPIGSPMGATPIHPPTPCGPMSGYGYAPYSMIPVGVVGQHGYAPYQMPIPFAGPFHGSPYHHGAFHGTTPYSMPGNNVPSHGGSMQMPARHFQSWSFPTDSQANFAPQVSRVQEVEDSGIVDHMKSNTAPPLFAASAGFSTGRACH